MSLHSDIDAGNIDFIHQVGTRMQNEGNDVALSLQWNSAATGGLVEFLSIPADGYSMHEVQPQMDGSNDAGVVYLVECRIKESELTASNAAKIAAIVYGTQRYQMEQMTAPSFTRRYWKLLLRPTETV